MNLVKSSVKPCSTGRLQNRARQPNALTVRRPVICRSVEQDVSIMRERMTRKQNLQKEIEFAVKLEDYAAAAQLKREFEEIEEQDPGSKLRRELQKAIEEERYQDAAQLNTEFQAHLAQEVAAAPLDLNTIPTSSNVSTYGIRIKVRSFYLPSNSVPTRSRFTFGYHVTIINESSRVVQLRNRHWIITDEEGSKEEVKGPGVVGAQPVLLPGKSFEYSSGSPLKCRRGFMMGSYQFAVLDEEEGNFKEMLDVPVGRFKLSAQEGDQ